MKILEGKDNLGGVESTVRLTKQKLTMKVNIKTTTISRINIINTYLLTSNKELIYLKTMPTCNIIPKLLHMELC